ncbi:MAG TPA: DNA alkylation repair protein [Pirellulaceae bacterium]|nr:DNA alkylation repair protein [Pirellulaceae bacterium]
MPRDVIEAILCGERSTKNLVEALAVDAFVVAERFLHAVNRVDLQARLDEVREEGAKWTFPKAVAAIGNEFGRLHDYGNIDDAFRDAMVAHPSDIVRSFGCFATTAREGYPVGTKLKWLKPLAADEHFGVREFAWMAVRVDVLCELKPAIRSLAKWTASADANVRRFASEATRPRGVWCQHIEALKRDPALALPILEPLRADPSDYVRSSVGNWLNDASKSQPDFVREVCERWTRESPVPETQAICRKALRTLEKA